MHDEVQTLPNKYCEATQLSNFNRMVRGSTPSRRRNIAFHFPALFAVHASSSSVSSSQAPKGDRRDVDHQGASK